VRSPSTCLAVPGLFREQFALLRSRWLASPTSAQTTVRQNVIYKTGLEEVLELSGGGVSSSPEAAVLSWRPLNLGSGDLGLHLSPPLTCKPLSSLSLSFLDNKMGITLFRVGVGSYEVKYVSRPCDLGYMLGVEI
jgi:hypothetical protein